MSSYGPQWPAQLLRKYLGTETSEQQEIPQLPPVEFPKQRIPLPASPRAPYLWPFTGLQWQEVQMPAEVAPGVRLLPPESSRFPARTPEGGPVPMLPTRLEPTGRTEMIPTVSRPSGVGAPGAPAIPPPIAPSAQAGVPPSTQELNESAKRLAAVTRFIKAYNKYLDTALEARVTAQYRPEVAQMSEAKAAGEFLPEMRAFIASQGAEQAQKDIETMTPPGAPVPRIRRTDSGGIQWVEGLPTGVIAFTPGSEEEIARKRRESWERFVRGEERFGLLSEKERRDLRATLSRDDLEYVDALDRAIAAARAKGEDPIRVSALERMRDNTLIARGGIGAFERTKALAESVDRLKRVATEEEGKVLDNLLKKSRLESEKAAREATEVGTAAKQMDIASLMQTQQGRLAIAIAAARKAQGDLKKTKQHWTELTGQMELDAPAMAAITQALEIVKEEQGK